MLFFAGIYSKRAGTMNKISPGLLLIIFSILILLVRNKSGPADADLPG